MCEQLGLLYRDEDDQAWELVTDQEEDQIRAWDVEDDAVKDLNAEGRRIEGPFRMSPRFADMPEVRVWGYTLRPGIQ